MTIESQGSGRIGILEISIFGGSLLTLGLVIWFVSLTFFGSEGKSSAKLLVSIGPSAQQQAALSKKARQAVAVKKTTGFAAQTPIEQPRTQNRIQEPAAMPKQTPMMQTPAQVKQPPAQPVKQTEPVRQAQQTQIKKPEPKIKQKEPAPVAAQKAQPPAAKALAAIPTPATKPPAAMPAQPPAAQSPKTMPTMQPMQTMLTKPAAQSAAGTGPGKTFAGAGFAPIDTQKDKGMAPPPMGDQKKGALPSVPIPSGPFAQKPEQPGAKSAGTAPSPSGPFAQTKNKHGLPMPGADMNKSSASPKPEDAGIPEFTPVVRNPMMTPEEFARIASLKNAEQERLRKLAEAQNMKKTKQAQPVKKVKVNRTTIIKRKIKVQGVLRTETGTMAVINDEVLSRGESIFGAQIIRISPEKVLFKHAGKIFSKTVSDE
ncbi:hypothetical protein ACFL6Y_03595 [Elusimicrobiota bacterium]